MLWIIASASGFHLKGLFRDPPKEEVRGRRSPVTHTYRPYSSIGGYGYLLLSNQDGDPVTFNYIDISTTGTATGATDDWCSGSDAGTLYSLGFSFPFYDQTISSISICSNGTVLLENTSEYVGFGNAPLPDSGYGYVGFVAPFWDDLNPSDASADDVYFQSFASCPDGYAGACAVVQYHNVPLFGGSVYMDFEVIFYDNGDIKFQYNSPMDYVDATVGMQDSTAATGSNPTWFLQYVYGGEPSSHIPNSGTAILFKLIPVQANDALIADVNPDEFIPVSPTNVTAKVFNADTSTVTSMQFHVDVYDTVSGSLVFSADTVADLLPRQLNTVTFPSFTPTDRSYYKAVVYVTDSRDPDPTYDTASTYFRTHVRVGDVLSSFSLLQDPLIGYNFSFITYNKTYGRFFISDMYGGVYSFDPSNPATTFRLENWAYAPIYDPYLNYPFGMATDGDSLFYLNHLEYDGWYVYDQHLASYREVAPGVFAWTGDSVNIFAVGSGIAYGMDWNTGQRDALWIIKSDGTSHAAIKIDPTTGSIRRTLPLTSLLDIPTGISYYTFTDELIVTDGKKVYRLDTLGNVLDAYYTPGQLPLYDLDLYEAGCPAGSTDPVKLYAVSPDSLNRVLIVATGDYCDQVVSVAEKPKVVKNVVSLHLNGRTVRLEGARGSAYVYDMSGRRLAVFRTDGSYTFTRSGVFFVRYEDRVFKVVVR